MKEKRFGLPALIITAFATLLTTLAAVALCAWLFIGPQGLTLLEGWGLIQTLFVGDYQADELLDHTMSAMVAGTGDRWSYYLTRTQYADLLERRANTYVGVGITVRFDHEGGLLIELVEPGGPAALGGLVPGDLITAVDGTDISGEARHTAVDLISGEQGAAVTLDLLAADGTTRTVTLMRDVIRSHPVEFELLDGQVGYIWLKNFYNHSAEEACAAVESLIAEGAASLVFDLRNNPGGYLDELTDLLDYLLPEGPIFSARTKEGEPQVTHSDAACVDLPMVVLVNADSYSAAELFAAQLRESVAAPIVGEVTSGKGYSQQTFPLPSGGAMGVSTGEYTTGGGLSLVGTGILPDVELEPAAGVDNQLEAALALLGD